MPATLLLVLRYGDDLQTFASQSEAEAFIRRHLPLLPDKVWDEDEDCETVTEYDIEVSNGDVKFRALA